MSPSSRASQAEQRWRKALANLRVWKKGATRAPHKPLLTLLLIARAARSEEGTLRFQDVDAPLARLLREFGPPRASVHPEYPFWHLRSDGIWTVRDAETLPLKKAGHSPTRRTLLARAAEGDVPPALWTELVGNGALRRDLAHDLLEAFWPSSMHDAILTAIGLDLAEPSAPAATRTRRDPAFRPRVLAAYERHCAVCGYDGRLQGDDLALEAAHIRWHCYDGPDLVTNGLLLCSFHHVAFDRGALGLTDDRRVLVSKEVSGGEATEEWLSRYHGRVLQGPRDAADIPQPRFVRWHRRQVFREPPRAVPA